MAADVVVYTRPGCMFCQQVEELLGEAHVPFRSRVISDREEQDRICRQHGALSFPVVVVDDVYAGGFTHVVHLHAQGKLPTIAGLDPAEVGQEPDSDRPRVGSLEGYAALGRLMSNDRNDGR